MNKLYVINFKLSNGYTVSTFTAWNRDIIEKKIKDNPEWKFRIVEENCVHTIYEAR